MFLFSSLRESANEGGSPVTWDEMKRGLGVKLVGNERGLYEDDGEMMKDLDEEADEILEDDVTAHMKHPGLAQFRDSMLLDARKKSKNKKYHDDFKLWLDGRHPILNDIHITPWGTCSLQKIIPTALDWKMVAIKNYVERQTKLGDLFLSGTMGKPRLAEWYYRYLVVPVYRSMIWCKVHNMKSLPEDGTALVRANSRFKWYVPDDYRIKYPDEWEYYVDFEVDPKRGKGAQQVKRRYFVYPPFERDRALEMNTLPIDPAVNIYFRPWWVEGAVDIPSSHTEYMNCKELHDQFLEGLRSDASAPTGTKTDDQGRVVRNLFPQGAREHVRPITDEDPESLYGPGKADDRRLGAQVVPPVEAGTQGRRATVDVAAGGAPAPAPDPVVAPPPPDPDPAGDGDGGGGDATSEEEGGDGDGGVQTRAQKAAAEEEAKKKAEEEAKATALAAEKAAEAKKKEEDDQAKAAAAAKAQADKEAADKAKAAAKEAKQKANAEKKAKADAEQAAREAAKAAEEEAQRLADEQEQKEVDALLEAQRQAAAAAARPPPVSATGSTAPEMQPNDPQREQMKMAAEEASARARGAAQPTVPGSVAIPAALQTPEIVAANKAVVEAVERRDAMKKPSRKARQAVTTAKGQRTKLVGEAKTVRHSNHRGFVLTRPRQAAALQEAGAAQRK